MYTFTQVLIKNLGWNTDYNWTHIQSYYYRIEGNTNGHSLYCTPTHTVSKDSTVNYHIFNLPWLVAILKDGYTEQKKNKGDTLSFSYMT